MRIFAINFLLLVLLITVETGCSAKEEAVNSAAPAVPETSEQAAPAEGANALLAEGIKLLEEGETQPAIDVLLKAVELDPGLADAYFQLGIAYSLIEKRDAAALRTDAEAEPTPTPDRKSKNSKEVKTNSELAFEKAVAAYKKQIAADAGNAAAHYNLGRAYNKLDEDEEAAKSLKQAVKLNPEDTEYQTELGAILIKLAQYREAIPPLKKALELDPANSRAEDLLSDAEAGRRRIDYSVPKKDGKTDNRAVTNASSAANASSSNSNSRPPSGKPVNPAFPANRLN